MLLRCSSKGRKIFPRCMSSHGQSFDNLWRRLAARPITGACERSLAVQFCRSLGQAWPIGGHLPYAKGDAFYVINYCLPRSFAIYLVTYGPSSRFNLRSHSLSPFPLSHIIILSPCATTRALIATSNRYYLLARERLRQPLIMGYVAPLGSRSQQRESLRSNRGIDR